MTYENLTDTQSLWQRSRAFVSESLRDNETDFTVGPIGRALGLLAIPMMLEMGMEAIFAVVDIAFVSRLGTNAIAAVGLTEDHGAGAIAEKHGEMTEAVVPSDVVGILEPALFVRQQDLPAALAAF